MSELIYLLDESSWHRKRTSNVHVPKNVEDVVLFTFYTVNSYGKKKQKIAKHLACKNSLILLVIPPNGEMAGKLIPVAKIISNLFTKGKGAVRIQARYLQKDSGVVSTEMLKKLLEGSEPSEPKKMKIESKCVLRFAKLTEQALAPVRGSDRAAGLDLRSAYDLKVPARGKAIVKTDLQVQVPEGSYGRVAPRSGLAVKNFIDVGAGVIDEDYRGNLGVVLFNHSDVDFEVKRGDRIAQLICERIFYPELEEVDKLDDTERGASGFGSTGIKGVAVKNGNGSAPMETKEEKVSEAARKELASKVGTAKTAEVAKNESQNSKQGAEANIGSNTAAAT